MLEVRAGTGGDEAALFAGDLLRMYQRFAEAQGWRFELISASPSEIGGYKEAIASINGAGVFAKLKFESGVHRVQRVPVTESGGRIHTSAATVAVLPEAEDVDVQIDDKDLRIDVYRSSGPGGQSVNTTDSAVRITHLPTGLVVIQQDEKSQHKNKAKALKVLRTRLFELERDRLASERAGARKSMVGSGDRSERIRTYNFPQGRITDHRINLTLHKLGEVLEGPGLGEIVDALVGRGRGASGWRASTRREARHPRARRCRAPARADQRHGAARCRAADGRSAAHRPRPLLLAPPDRTVPDRFWAMVDRRQAGEPVAYITGSPRLLEHRAPRRPRSAGSAARQRGADRLGDRAFRGNRRPAAHPRSRHRTRHAAAGRARYLAGGYAGSASTSRARRSLTLRPTRGGSASRRGSNGCRAIGRDGLAETFDLILCNPPYIADGAELGPGVAEYEPDEALFAGEHGLDAYRALGPQLPRLLEKGGLAAVEIGLDQSEAVTGLLARDGLQARVAADLAGRPRALLLTWV